MEKMLRKSFIRHELRNKESLLVFTTTPNQIRQPLTA